MYTVDDVETEQSQLQKWTVLSKNKSNGACKNGCLNSCLFMPEPDINGS